MDVLTNRELSGITLMSAVSENGFIAIQGQTPWGRSLKTDLDFFRKYTLEKTVVMGRKTAEQIVNEIGKMLPNRQNIVFSRNRNLTLPGNPEITDDADSLLRLSRTEEVVIIGGGEIYTLFYPYTKKMLITQVVYHCVYDETAIRFSPFNDGIELDNRFACKLINDVKASKTDMYDFKIFEYTAKSPRT